MRAQGKALGRQGLCHVGHVGAQGSLGQRPVDHVALGMAAAKGVHDVPRGPEPFGGVAVASGAEGGEAFDQRVADAADPVGRFTPACTGHARQHSLDRIVPPGAQMGHCRMEVVERIELAVGQNYPCRRDGSPAVADIDPHQVKPPQQRCRIDEILRRGAATDRAVEQRERRCGVTQFDVAQRPVPPVVHLQEVLLGGPVCFAPGDPGKALGGPEVQ